jgi:hypothetical protein
VIVLDNRRVTRLEKVKEGSSELVVHLEDGTKVSHGFAVSCIHLPFPLSAGFHRIDD